MNLATPVRAIAVACLCLVVWDKCIRDKAQQVSKCNRGIAISFDDGPGPITEEILGTLEKHHTVATFFWLPNTEISEKRISRLLAGGHELGAHTINHTSLTGMSTSEIIRELSLNLELFHNLSAHKVNLFRPPFGATTKNINRVIEKRGLKVVLWSSGGKYPPDKEHEIKEAQKMKEGDIMLLHLEHNEAQGAAQHLNNILHALPKDIPRYTISECMLSNPPSTKPEK